VAALVTLAEGRPDGAEAPAGVVDGRSLRRRNSFERAVDALLDLIERGNPAPTAQQIADHAAMSVRTVFRLTADLESLHAAAVQRQMERTAHLYDMPLPTAGSLRTRIRALLAHRVRVLETIAPVRRVAARLAGESPRIAEGLELQHLLLRTQVAEVFEPELSRLPRSRRLDALHAADVAAGWETWDQLRRTVGLPVAESVRVVTLLLEGALRT